MQLLPNIHLSPDTAYVVADYPYGFNLRCKIRYWVEFKKGHGCRVVSQTTNPKRGHVWNKPKGGTYSKFGAALYLDDENHVQARGLSEYCDGAEAQAFLDTYGAGVPEAAQELLKRWVAAKVAYDAKRAAVSSEGTARDTSLPLTVGLKEAGQAFVADPNKKAGE